MSYWRRIALEHVPSCRREIEQADNPLALWNELYERLQTAYFSQPPDNKTIRQIYHFAVLCLNDKRNDELIEAVSIAIFESLSMNAIIRQDLPNHISRTNFFDAKPCLSCFMGKDEFMKFEKEFLAAKDKQLKS